MRCSICKAEYDQINRCGVEAEWFQLWDNSWSLSLREKAGSHFHLFCTNGHMIKLWADELPEGLQNIVLAGHTILSARDVA